jgi:putative hydrolase of the HAD superfamily
MQIDTDDTVFVFDLDDTLYKESDYYSSGIQAVINKVQFIYGIDVRVYFKNQIKAKTKDIWGALCEDWNLSITIKESLIWEYRLHKPDIKLSDSIQGLIVFLEENSAGVAILTDGRSVTQRLKINALGLSHLPCFISDEHSEIKPDPLRFQMIEKMFPDKRYVYLGDNLKKDFLAPNNLGWTTFCIKDDGRNVHTQDLSQIADDYLPSCWLTKLEELKKYLC